MLTFETSSKPTYVVPDWVPLRPTWTSIIRPDKGMTAEDFQATGTSAIICKPRHYLCDDMGLGKTKQAVDAQRYVWFKEDCRPMRALHIVKAGGLDSWRDEFLGNAEIEQPPSFPEATVTLLRGTQAERHAIMNEYLRQQSGYQVLLVGYEIFRMHHEWCEGVNLWDWIVADEAHKLCSTPLNKSQAAVAKLIHRVHAPRQTALSGTPIPDTPEDAYNVNLWLGFEDRSWQQFEDETLLTIQFSPSRKRPGFRLKKVVNYKPEGLLKLNRLLNSGIMTRRTKNDELDLPGKTHIHRPVLLNNEEVRIYKLATKALLEDAEGQKTIIEPLNRFDRLIQITSSLECITNTPYVSSKIKTCLDIIEEAGDQKVILYSRFIPTLRGLYRATKKYNPAFITGQSATTVKQGHSVSERREMELKFQTDPACRVFLGSTKACMEQLTLTAGTIVVFIDKLWAPKQNEQAEDRANRIGTTKGITIITLDAYLPGRKPKPTIDDYRNKRLAQKAKITDSVMSDDVMSYAQYAAVLK